MPDNQPRIVILAGPNGAGKSTSAAKLLLGPLQVTEFVNADVIAQGLSAFAQQNVAMQAGRVMLRRLQQLAAARQDFAFETTLATRSYAKWLRELQQAGYCFDLLFLWLPSAEMAIARVADRVRAGGHHVPEDVIVRRYRAGLRNLTQLYIPLADSWKVIDNTSSTAPHPIAAGFKGRSPIVFQETLWQATLAENRT
jgi:predicted ABC-type ATPase